MNIGKYTNPKGWKSIWNDDSDMASAGEDLMPRQEKLDSFTQLPVVKVSLIDFYHFLLGPNEVFLGPIEVFTSFGPMLPLLDPIALIWTEDDFIS